MNVSNSHPIRPEDVPQDLWYRAAVQLIEQTPDPDQRANLRMTFEERAAICEYDGGLSRAEAERIAFHELRMAVNRIVLEEGGP